MNPRVRIAALLSAAVLLGVTWIGCANVEDSGAVNFSTVDAKGKISAAGKPLTKGIVVLEPILDGGSTQQASGEIKPDGTFELLSPGGKEGAMPGKYRVKVDESDYKAAAGAPPVEVEVPASGGELNIQLP